MIDRLITDFVMWWCKKKILELREKDKKITIFEIKGTGKHEPNYLMYTDKEHVKREMLKI